MGNIERQVWREARAMTRREVITKAIAGELSWAQAAVVQRGDAAPYAADSLDLKQQGMDAVMDQPGGRPWRKRILAGTVEMLCRLKRDIYPDFSRRDLYEHVTEKHGIKVSYNWLRLMLQEAGVWSEKPRAASTGASVSAGRWWGCWSSNWMPRPMSGPPGCRCRTWWWHWTTQTAGFCMPAFFRRMAPPPASPP